jgi:squalene-hopene/tetraprenyl-beta-curcumene cyclase
VLDYRLMMGAGHALRYLMNSRRPDDSWNPLWFGNQDAPDEENSTYGTARVLLGLAAHSRHMNVRLQRPDKPAGRLAGAQNADGGWGGAPGVLSSVEETALAVQTLATVSPDDRNSLERGVTWLIDHTDGGRLFRPSPIGFYFARLWYYEELYAPIFTVGALEAAGVALGSR